MNNALEDFPDLSKSLGQLKVLVDLNEKANENTFLGYAVKKAFINKQPNKVIVQTLKDALNDNPRSLNAVFPAELIERFKKYF